MHAIVHNILCENSLQYSLLLLKYLPSFFIIDAVKTQLVNIWFDKTPYFKYTKNMRLKPKQMGLQEGAFPPHDKKESMFWHIFGNEF